MWKLFNLLKLQNNEILLQLRVRRAPARLRLHGHRLSAEESGGHASLLVVTRLLAADLYGECLRSSSGTFQTKLACVK